MPMARSIKPISITQSTAMTKVSGVLTGVYYFHAMPKAFQGGNIRLLPLRQSSDAERFLDVEPINDRLLLFPSWVPHCVMPVVSTSSAFSDSRFAINCWYRKRKHTE